MVWISLLAALPLLVSAPAEKPFVDGGYAQAVEQAKASDRLVLIDFFTTWCGPCKQMDRTTWTDEGVRSWIAASAVAVKVDADKEVGLAQRYHIEGYPTVVFVDGDEHEVGRLKGYRSATHFLADAKKIAEGHEVPTPAPPPETSAEPAPAPPPANELRARIAKAHLLVQEEKPSHALDEYVWCLDHGAEIETDFPTLRPFLLRDVQQLGKTYPQAMEELTRRRDTQHDAVLAGLGTPDGMKLLDELNEMLGEEAKSLELFDELGKRGAAFREVRLELGRAIGPRLIGSRRYADFLECHPDPVERVERDFARFTDEVGAQGVDPADDAALAARKRELVGQAGLTFQALLGSQREAEAQRVFELAKGFESSVRCYCAFVANAVRAGDAKTAKLLAMEGLKTLPEDQAAELRSTLKYLGVQL